MPVNDDLTLLRDVARAAGEIAMRFWRKSPEVWEKAGNEGPVTEADLAVDRMLRKELLAARPHYGWLSEETPDDATRLNHERVFIVDPIDGTRAFIEGTPDFAHSLAVAEAGRVVAAVVFLPAQGNHYAAASGQVATLNGEPIKCSGQSELRQATLLTARPNLLPEHWRDGLVPQVKRHFRSSLAWRLCLAAEGRFDGMLTLRPSWEWDIAAGWLIAQQAGAVVSDRNGAMAQFNGKDAKVDGCIAAGSALHSALLTRLRR